MTEALTFDNLREFIDEMQKLPQAIQTRVMKGAVATGASVVRKASIARAPIYFPRSIMWGGGGISANHPPPGTLKKSIYQMRVSDECTPTLEVWKVDVRSGARETKNGTQEGAYYAHMVERGHYTRTPSGKGPRKTRQALAIASGKARWIAPNPFMRPAFDESQEAALQAMAVYIAQNLYAATDTLRFIKALGS